MTSSVPSVGGNDDKMHFVNRPRGFYIDDILASDFGHRCLEQRRCVSSEFDTTMRTVADTAAAYTANHPKDAGRTISVSKDRVPESDKSLIARTRPCTSSRSPSSSVTSSRRFHGKVSTDSTISSSSSSSSNCDRKMGPKPGRSTNTDVTANNDTTGTICDVTSSTTSLSSMKPGCTADDDKDRFTLPAWVYCTRYSDRPSAGKYLDYMNSI